MTKLSAQPDEPKRGELVRELRAMSDLHVVSATETTATAHGEAVEILLHERHDAIPHAVSRAIVRAGFATAEASSRHGCQTLWVLAVPVDR